MGNTGSESCSVSKRRVVFLESLCLIATAA